MPSNVGLRNRLVNDVFGGRDPFRMLTVTNTGTGLGTASYRLGQIVLDSSAGDWFLCTVTASGGTWVKIIA